MTTEQTDPLDEALAKLAEVTTGDYRLGVQIALDEAKLAEVTTGDHQASMTTTAPIDELLTAAGAPQVTTEQRVRFAVLAARAASGYVPEWELERAQDRDLPQPWLERAAWENWATAWLDGSDRSSESAEEAAEEAARAAAGGEAWAAKARAEAAKAALAWAEAKEAAEAALEAVLDAARAADAEKAEEAEEAEEDGEAAEEAGAWKETVSELRSVARETAEEARSAERDRTVLMKMARLASWQQPALAMLSLVLLITGMLTPTGIVAIWALVVLFGLMIERAWTR